MIEKIYRLLWTKIGGRPWTYIIRDNQSRHPLLWLFIFLGIGALLGHLFW